MDELHIPFSLREKVPRYSEADEGGGVILKYFYTLRSKK